MDYQAIYDRIIERNRNTPKIKKQTEDHHIIPKSFARIDGIEDIHGSWNRVNLPLREHFLAHLLLARIHRNNGQKGYKTAMALKMMSSNGRYNSKDYSWLRLNYNHTEDSKNKMKRPLSENHKQKLKDAWVKRKEEGKINKHTEETKAKIGNARRGKKMSEETLERMKKSKEGFSHSEETKRKISKSNKGRKLEPRTDEHRRKLSESKKGKPIKPRSVEHQQKLNESARNRKPISDETRRKMSEAHKRRLSTHISI